MEIYAENIRLPGCEYMLEKRKYINPIYMPKIQNILCKGLGAIYLFLETIEVAILETRSVPTTVSMSALSYFILAVLAWTCSSTWFFGRDLTGTGSSNPPHPISDSANSNFSSTVLGASLLSVVEAFESLNPVFNNDNPWNFNSFLTTGSQFSTSSCAVNSWFLNSPSWLQRPYGAWSLFEFETFLCLQ